VKGVGETGTIASPVAVINAVNDALSHLGDIDVGRPATPERVWRAIHGRGAAAPSDAEGPGAGAGTGSADRAASDGGEAR
jgi:carbon-monoxide dehydrogenase large subunit